MSEVEISKKKQKELKHVAQSGLEIGFGFIFTFLNDKHLKFLSLAKPRLGFSTVSLYTFLMKKIWNNSFKINYKILKTLSKNGEKFRLKKDKNISFNYLKF